MESKMAHITATHDQNNVNASTTEGTTPAAKKPRGRPSAKSQPSKKPAPAVNAATSKAGHGTAAAAKKPGAVETKASIILKKLGSPKGATIQMMMEATDWQAHSVRGFLSAVVKKKLGLNLVSEAGKDGVRRYRIHADGKTG
jgi:hypothetical protein